jgi:uncharacterized protein YeeX (DUF496 family)
MSVINRIDMLVSEDRLRGFKDKKEIGLEIEDMEMNIEDKDKKKFTRLLDTTLKKVDPEMQLSIVKAVIKLKDRDAIALFDKLSDLHYH